MAHLIIPILLGVLCFQCSNQSRGIELHAIIEMALTHSSPWALDSATRAADAVTKSCCTQIVRSDNELKKCIHGLIDGKSAHPSEERNAAWVLSYQTDEKASIIACASSYEVYGDLDIKGYLERNGFTVKKKLCGNDNSEANGSFVYECSKAGVPPFYLRHSFSSGSGGYDFSVEIYRQVPPSIFDEATQCES